MLRIGDHVRCAASLGKSVAIAPEYGSVTRYAVGPCDLPHSDDQATTRQWLGTAEKTGLGWLCQQEIAASSYAEPPYDVSNR